MMSILILVILNWLAIIEIMALFLFFTRNLVNLIEKKDVAKPVWFIVSAVIYLLIYVGAIESWVIISNSSNLAVTILLLKVATLSFVLLALKKFKNKILMNPVLVSIISEINK